MQFQQLCTRCLFAWFACALLLSCSSSPDASSEDGFDLSAFDIRADQRERDVSVAPDAGGSRPAGDVSRPDVAPDVPPAYAADGAPCADADDCLGDLCLSDPAWPEGMCSSTCEISCGEDYACVDLNEQFACLPRCTDATGCRSGYRCGYRGRGNRVCLPNNVDALGRADGDPCELNADCAGGTCLQEPEYPLGYCTTLYCESAPECARLAVVSACYVPPTGADNFCARVCTADEECRDGYECLNVVGSQGVCVPLVEPEPPPEPPENPLTEVCGFASERGEVVIPFTISPETTAFFVNAYAGDGLDIVTSELRSAEQTYRLPSILYNTLWPIVALPVSSATGVDVIPGEWQLVLSTSSEDVCLVLITEEEPGEVIDLNFWMLESVGVNGLTWETAPDDPDMERIMLRVRRLFSENGLTVRTIRFPEVVPGTSRTVIRSDLGVGAIALEGGLPGDTPDEVLSVNVFIVEAITYGPLGVSPVPGPAGLHGFRGTGVAVDGRYIGESTLPFVGASDPDFYVALVIVHEVGHYLGLGHDSSPLNIMQPIANQENIVFTPPQMEVFFGNVFTKPESGFSQE